LEFNQIMIGGRKFGPARKTNKILNVDQERVQVLAESTVSLDMAFRKRDDTLRLSK
jgi:hypothetical protein